MRRSDRDENGNEMSLASTNQSIEVRNRMMRRWSIGLLVVPLTVGIILAILQRITYNPEIGIDGLIFLPSGLALAFMLFIPFAIICTIIAVVLIIKSSLKGRLE